MLPKLDQSVFPLVAVPLRAHCGQGNLVLFVDDEGHKPTFGCRRLPIPIHGGTRKVRLKRKKEIVSQVAQQNE
jgi:hypothetical protein